MNEDKQINEMNTLMRNLANSNNPEQVTLNAREAITGFVAWLTSRSITTTFGAKHNATEACDLANHFCNVNNLPECRDDWTKNLTHPEN